MKSRMIVTTLLVALCAVACAAQSAPAQGAVPEDPGAKKARAILDRMIQAMGGEAFLTYADMTQQGRAAAFYHGTPSGTSTPYWLFWKWPDMERVEVSKQRDIVYIHNGDKGYEVTYKGTRAQDPEDHKEYERNRQYALQVVLRRWLKQPGTTLFYEGVGVVDQKQVDKITVLNANNQSVTFSIDAYTHLLVRKSYQWREPDTRFFDQEEEAYGNYHLVQGIQTPRSLVTMHNGDVTRQRFVDVTSYNNGLADSMFQTTITYDPLEKKKK